MSATRVGFGLGFALTVVLTAPQLAEAACTISTTSVSFGTYDVFAATPVDSAGSVTYRCGNDRNITVTLGRGSSPTFSPRQMVKGTETLSYNLFLDAARTQIWGDGTGGTQFHSNANPPNNRDVTVTIFGRIPAGQDVSAGGYADTITATITF